MTFYLLDLYVIAALCLFLAVLFGGAGLVCRIGQAIDERHTPRPCDCDEPGDRSATSELCEPGECVTCDDRRAWIERERER